MPVFLTAVKEESFQLVHFFDQLLSHRFAQGVALTSGEVGEQSRQKHDLFLIDSYAVGVLEVFLHYGDIVDNRFATMFTGNEIGYIVHRPRTIEGVHGYEVFKCGWL